MYNGEKTGVWAWCISTGVKIPYMFKWRMGKEGDPLEWKDWKEGNPLIALGDDFVGEWHPQFEFIVGKQHHHVLVNAYGTQPKNTYLYGHFSWPPAPPNVIVQQYFLAGCWGFAPPSLPWAGTPTVKEQVKQNNVGIPLLFDLGILRSDVEVVFSDQSKVEPMLRDQRTFKGKDGKDLLRQYYPYLKNYLKDARAKDFNIPIEEVVEWIPTSV